MIKQRGGMLAKGRLLGLQFSALMEDDLYFQLGRKAVAQAMRIRDALKAKGLLLYVDSPTNQLFPILTEDQLERLTAEFDLSVWESIGNDATAVRVCTSWATPDAYVDQFIDAVNRL